MANLLGSSEGKYGAKMQSAAQRRRSNLQEAQGEVPPISIQKEQLNQELEAKNVGTKTKKE